MWRPQRERWHPALHQWDRRPHRQTRGATQTVRFPSSYTCMNQWCLWLYVILRPSFSRLKLHPQVTSRWHIFPAWKICCCLSTLGISPTIRFHLNMLMGLWYKVEGRQQFEEQNLKKNTTQFKVHATEFFLKYISDAVWWPVHWVQNS